MTAREHDQPPLPMPENVVAFPRQEWRRPDVEKPPPPEHNEDSDSDHEPGYGHGV